VAIMASKLVRIGREVGEINELLDRRAEAKAAGAEADETAAEESVSR